MERNEDFLKVHAGPSSAVWKTDDKYWCAEISLMTWKVAPLGEEPLPVKDVRIKKYFHEEKEAQEWRGCMVNFLRDDLWMKTT